MKSILLVDDDPQLLRLLLRQLQSQTDHWNLTTACNGLEALRLLKDRPFDLLITDILMPEHDGFETIHEVRKARPAMEIIAMSGGGQRVGVDFLRVARALGAHEVLQKPISQEVLIETIRRVFSSPGPDSQDSTIAEAPTKTPE